LEILALNDCSKLDSKMLKVLVEGSPKLREVNLCRLRSLSGCAEILECGLKNLETFRAANCPLLQGTEEAVLRQSCPKIKTFSLRNIDAGYSKIV
jgi:hypothetical protein